MMIMMLITMILLIIHYDDGDDGDNDKTFQHIYIYVCIYIYICICVNHVNIKCAYMRGALLVSWGHHDDETTPAAKMIALRALSDIRAVTFTSPNKAGIYTHVE